MTFDPHAFTNPASALLSVDAMLPVMKAEAEKWESYDADEPAGLAASVLAGYVLDLISVVEPTRTELISLREQVNHIDLTVPDGEGTVTDRVDALLAERKRLSARIELRRMRKEDRKKKGAS